MTTTTSFRYSHTIGFLARRFKGFNNPVDVALDSAGTLYVVSRSGPEISSRLEDKRITICTVGEDFLGEIGTGGSGEGQFMWPSSLAFDSKDRLYVADEALNRISIFTRENEFLGHWGTQGSGEGQFNRPSSIAFDGHDNLYVTDSLNHRVQYYHRNGEFLRQWGGLGTGPGQFNMPWGVVPDRQGNVYVSDWRNDRIQKFDSAGDFLLQIGSSGDEDGQFHRPAGLSVDAEGNIYVADWGNERVQVLSQQGEVLAKFRGDATNSAWAQEYFVANPEEGAARLAADLEPPVDPPEERYREESASIEKYLWGPTAVKLDSAGRIYIVDSCRHRLQIYRKG